MRGPILFAVISSLVLCGAALAQKVQFSPADKSVVLARMEAIPESNQQRAERMRELFIQAGCGGSLTEQKVEGQETPNIICRLGREQSDTVIVGAHYDCSSPQRLDNWSGAALLPAIYQGLRRKKREHSFLFVAFADRGDSPAGAESFARSLSPSQLEHTGAMVNLDVLGLSPTKVWAAHSDKDLVHSLIVMVYALKIPASQVDLTALGSTDSDPFAARGIPQITIHSLTQQNVRSGSSTQFQPNNYYASYRLLCGYLAYLDRSLKPRPHTE
jgi:Peptidase family M28